MTAVAVLLAFGLTATSPAEGERATLRGRVTVHAGSPTPRVKLSIASAVAPYLVGPMATELARLQSATVEVTGRYASQKDFEVTDYVVLDLGGGVRPYVGVLERGPTGFRLRDGDGEPIALSVSSRLGPLFAEHVEAKVWVVGARLVSGELKISRFGVLRPRAPKTPAPKQPTPTTP